MYFRPLPIMSACTVLALSILVWLGNWQYGKFDRKSISSTTIATSVDTIEGHIISGTVIQLYGVIEGKPVWRQIRPVQTKEGDVYLTNMGVYMSMIPNVAKIDPPRSEKFTASGWKKPIQDIGWFGRLIAPQNSPEKNLYHTIDISAWTKSLAPEIQSELVNTHVFEPFEIQDINAPGNRIDNPYAYPDADPLPPERHLGYAWTWWGMALVLICIYFAYHRKENRLRFGGKN